MAAAEIRPDGRLRTAFGRDFHFPSLDDFGLFTPHHNNDDPHTHTSHPPPFFLPIAPPKHRCDAVVGEGEGAYEIVREVRMALEHEYFVLTSSCENDVLSSAVLLVHDDSMRLPIHLACDKNAPLSILRNLLDADCDKASMGVPDKWGGESYTRGGGVVCGNNLAHVIGIQCDVSSSPVL